MKKLVLLIATIIICSCCSLSKISDKRVLPESERTIYIERFEMDGHDYISFSTIYNYYYPGQNFTVVHDPECLKRDMLDCLIIDPD